VARHLHVPPDLRDPAVPVDQHGGALDAHVLAAVEALLDPQAQRRDERAALVRDEREVEAVLGAEPVVALEAVGRDPDDLRVGRRECRPTGLEILGLLGAAARVVLGVEIEHGLAALQRVAADRPPAGRRQGEGRRLVAQG
jgi:hypothetical protein